MQEADIIKFIKKIFSNQNFLSVFLTSLFLLIVIFTIVAGLVWYFRANLFEYFAKEYLQEMQNLNLNNNFGVLNSKNFSSFSQPFGQG